MDGWIGAAGIHRKIRDDWEQGIFPIEEGFFERKGVRNGVYPFFIGLNDVVRND